LQKRFRTRPSRADLPRIKTIVVDKAREQGGIQIPANARSVQKHVVPLGPRLLRQRAVHMIKLGQVFRVLNSIS
jgi:hypothetical protein